MQRLNPNQQSVNIVCKLPARTAQRLERLAQAAGVSKSDIMRSALLTYCALMGLREESNGN